MTETQQNTETAKQRAAGLDRFTSFFDFTRQTPGRGPDLGLCLRATALATKHGKFFDAPGASQANLDFFMDKDGRRLLLHIHSHSPYSEPSPHVMITAYEKVNYIPTPEQCRAHLEETGEDYHFTRSGAYRVIGVRVPGMLGNKDYKPELVEALFDEAVKILGKRENGLAWYARAAIRERV